jgi:beta-glucosidase
MMAVRFRLGEFDPAKENPYAELPEELVNCAAHKALNNKAAKEQVILLKNDGLLPLRKERKQKIAVLGPLADKNYMDWYTGYSDYNISVLEGLKELAGDENIVYDNACDRIAIKSKATGRYLSVKENEAVIADAAGIGPAEIFEYHDWDFGSQNLFSLKNNRFLREEKDIKASGTDTYAWSVKEWLKCRAYRDSAPAEAYNLLMDSWNDLHLMTDREGRLTAGEQTNPSKDRLFGMEVLSDGIARAVKLAKASDLAIVCVGNDPLQVARECYDRPGLSLPKHQSELIKAVHEANPRTTVVIVSSYPYAVNWEKENIPAMLFSSHAGPELGHAVADVLFGSYNPAGRTPVTWYQSVHELPDIMDYDIIKNDMTYLYYRGEPLYPFGYGLSYSTFRYGDLQIEKLQAEDNGQKNKPLLKITLTVENTSETDGEEVVQLYYRINNPRVKRPLRQLCGFRRIFIKAGRQAGVEFIVRESELEFYDVTREKFCVEAGEYTFSAGGNCLDRQVTANVFLEGETIPPQTLRRCTPAIHYDDKSGVEIRFSKERNAHYIAAGRGADRHFIKFGTVDFTGTASVGVDAATAVGRAFIYLHADTPDSEPLTILEVPITGGPEHFVKVTGAFKPPEGVHDLYLVLDQGISIFNLQFC